jgi:hypothetical protein
MDNGSVCTKANDGGETQSSVQRLFARKNPTVLKKNDIVTDKGL